MEDKGQMNEVIEQMKLMNVLLSKHDKREETKEYNASWRVQGPQIFFIFLFLIVVGLVLNPKPETRK